MKRLLFALLVLAMIGGGVAPRADAAPVIRFDNPLVDGGTLTYDGELGPLVGTNILYQNVIGVDTPANDGAVLTCVGNCVLDFETGANTLEGGPLYTWTGGGDFVLLGTLVDDMANVIAVGTTLADPLLRGTFLTPVVGTTDGIQLNISALGTDLKDVDLVSFYGIFDNTFNFSHTDISANVAFGGNGSFSGAVTETDLTNLGTIPLPGTLLLMGLGTFGLLLARRRR